MLVFIGTQQALPGQGITAAWLDPSNGHLVPLGTAAEVERPTWVLADPVRPLVYAVRSVGNRGECLAEVLSFAVERTDGKLRLLSRTSSGGGGATHLALDPEGDRLFVANFGGGQVATIPVSDDGRLDAPLSIQTNYGSGPHPRQTGPHAHGVTLDPSRRFLLVPDMGADRLFIYRYDHDTGSLLPGDPPFAPTPPGSGPRKAVFSEDGRHLFLLTELSAEIFSYRWNAEAGQVDLSARVALDADPSVENRSAAVLVMSGDGRFLYTSNRRTSALHVFAIDAASGVLIEVQQIHAGGEKPWGAELSPDGKWLVVANQASNVVRTFAINPDSGLLSETATGLVAEAPTGIAFAGMPYAEQI